MRLFRSKNQHVFPPLPMETHELKEVTFGNFQFSNKFYDIFVKENPDKNILFSPLSAHAVLALAYQGASGETEKCFAKALDVSSKTSSAKGYNALLNQLNSTKYITLNTVNKIFIMKDFKIKKPFLKTASTLFLSEIQGVDFKKNVEAAAIINKWVEDKTQNKIKDLLDPSVLGENTSLVLVNAIYFKGNWVEPFKPINTKVEPFYVSNSESVDCNMMHTKESFQYCENEHLNAKILELHYINMDVSMVIVLPNARDGITNLEARLLGADLASLTDRCKDVEVEVSLPKFKIETTMDLENILTKMDLGVIFEFGKADFSDISSVPLYVSKVIQKTFIDVNEEGTEAAASTFGQVTLCCAKYQDKIWEFRADHPFIFFLQFKNKKSRIALFRGKIMNPVVPQ